MLSEILLMKSEPSAVCVTLLSENNFFIFASPHAVIIPVIAYVKSLISAATVIESTSQAECMLFSAALPSPHFNLIHNASLNNSLSSAL